MATLSLSVALEVGTLDIPGTGLWVDTLTRPVKQWRRARASSPRSHGSVQTHATLEDAQLEAVIYAEADTANGLEALRQSIEDAFFQFSYTLTVTEDGVVRAYRCDCADLSWNEHDSGMAEAKLAKATLTIPCYPLPVS